jgi:hypothetical protein
MIFTIPTATGVKNMNTEIILTFTFGLYFIGFFIKIWENLGEFLRPNSLELTKFKNLQAYYRHLILRTTLWPIFTLLKNPFHLLCESLFKSYNDPRVTYGGFGSFQNFYRDLIFGKNRYSAYTIGSYNTLAKIDAPFLKDKIPPEDLEYWKTHPLYLNVIYAFKGEQYLLSSICLPYSTKDIFTMSRYVLDRSERYAKDAFFKELSNIDTDISNAIEKQTQLNS